MFAQRYQIGTRLLRTPFPLNVSPTLHEPHAAAAAADGREETYQITSFIPDTLREMQRRAGFP